MNIAIFEYIVILCPTVFYNETYLKRPWVWQDDDVFCINPKEELFWWFSFFSKRFQFQETLFVIDDMISDEKLNKRRTPLLQLAATGRHKKHTLWFLTQDYTAIPKSVRRQKKQVFLWDPDDTSDFEQVMKETGKAVPRDKNIDLQLQRGPHTCLYIRVKYPKQYHILD